MPAVGSKKGLYRLLDLNEDGTGSHEMAVNGTSTPQIFMVKPGPGEKIKIERVLVTGISGNWNRADQFGAAGRLTNGIQVYTASSQGIQEDYTKQETLKCWTDFGLLAGSDVPTSGGSGADALVVRWTCNKGYQEIELVGDSGDFFAFKIQDNLSSLDYLRVAVQGSLGTT